ncbi:hypothetical protein L202_02362 [Cryptococcus amylolentus CBS 6039]|uniref:Wbp11/ELF5/Saf1 N-terminal domain-containing protein n=1 Tax=Cryptococcus amylolentus CBS 6039 TaxID=1295533 RepID=A0A1E3I0C3_9TREE|nr:hypothetical protein L202_02362 [Cryptococcus amylolentus CBS 6039]ODN82040.1 hypothetical protein L202_02362 [Cryptococcus amylolentus CBS 6039]
MAKKSGNPADAYRKQLKAKEQKKNKEARQKARDTQTAKKDTRELETEIRALKSQNDSDSKKRVQELEKELKYISGVKEKYVEEHPDEHDKVFRVRRRPEGEGQGESSGAGSDKFDQMGRLRDPKRSVYYDAVYNPYGAPPPGMPYRERTPEEESEEEDSDDDIVMPEGPRPDSGEDSDGDSDDSDYIPLPEGPPPPKPQSAPSLPLPNLGPPRPPHAPGFFHGPLSSIPPRPPYGMPQNVQPWGVPPPGFRPPPSGQMRGQFSGPPSSANLPPRPPPGGQPGAISAPPKPAAPVPAVESRPSTEAPASAEISAAPVLRDLRKEATTFVPRNIKKRKPGTAAPDRINAAPGAGEIDEDGDERRRARVEEEGGGLMGKLGSVLGAQTQASKSTKQNVDDDYQKFLEGLGDLG